MNKLKFLLLAVIAATSLHAQEKQGYYITNNNQKTEGFFRQGDFYDQNNLYFRTTAEKEYTLLNKKDIIEYGIDKAFKFQKHSLKVDFSQNNDLKRVSNVKEPVYEDAELFLNVIEEGTATLYSAKLDNRTLFFYSIKDKKGITQLVYKKYKVEDIITVLAENNMYRQQMYEDINCGNAPIQDYLKINYDKKDLLKLIKAYNECSGSTAISYSNKGSNEYKLKYRVFASAGKQSLSVNGRLAPGDKNNAGNSYGIGFEIGYLTPSKKWEYFAAIEVESVSASINTSANQGFNIVNLGYDLDANFISVFMGPRYNIYLGNKNKIFIDGAFGIVRLDGEVKLNSDLTTNTGLMYNTFSGSSSYSTADLLLRLGIGYEFNQKIALAINIETNKKAEFLSPATYFGNEIKLNRLGLLLKYTIN